MGWCGAEAGVVGMYVSALQKQGRGEVHVHVAVTSMIVQMSTRFVLHVVMVKIVFV